MSHVYGKATETAIAAMSRLAEVWDGGVTRLSASELAEARKLQKPFVGKVLTTLSQAGLVNGARGPGGGYALARHPKDIRIYDVFVLFERENDSLRCPFGGGICGVGENCPLHDKLVGVQEAISVVLHETTFDTFREAYQERGLRPEETTDPNSPTPEDEQRKRESYRAIK